MLLLLRAGGKFPPAKICSKQHTACSSTCHQLEFPVRKIFQVAENLSLPVENESDLGSVHSVEEVSHISILKWVYRAFHSVSLQVCCFQELDTAFFSP